MASHKLTTYIAKNPPDAVRLSPSCRHSSFHLNRKEKVKHQQKQKQKANQKVKKVLDLVPIKIQMKEVQTNKMEKQ